MHHTTQNQNFKFDFFDLVTLDDPDLTQGHKTHRRVLIELSQTRSMSFPRLHFSLLQLLSPVKPAMTENKNRPLTRPETSSVTFR